MIAALYVERNGIYSGLEGVDLWDETRDARNYPGSYPVVAHPPCARWCRMAGIAEARWGYKRGDDGGTFESALASVRRYGGVLEHPAYSGAWKAYGLPRPRRNGGWFGSDQMGWVAHVEQRNYGHIAKKATWLYAFGTNLPSLKWGAELDQHCTTQLVSWCGNNGDKRPRLGKRALATPLEFRDVLIAMARSAVQITARSESGFYACVPAVED